MGVGSDVAEVVCKQINDIDEFTGPAVLSNEVSLFKQLTKAQQPTAGMIVPVPRRLGRLGEAGLPRFLAVADERHYDPDTGYWDEPIR